MSEQGSALTTQADLAAGTGDASEERSHVPSANENTHGNSGATGAMRPIPRISIQVFCESSDTGEVFQRAAEDRRLAKAHLTVQMGGIAGAVEYFRESPTPNLIIVESAEEGERLFAALAQLAPVCDPSTKVVVIGQTNDITTYRELIRQGISEYLVAPLTPIQVLETISSLYVNRDAPPVGRSLAFIGAKGGVGASVLAHNVAWCIGERLKEDTVVVDLDLAFGTAGLDFNQDPTQGVADALTAPERVDEVLLERLLVRCTDHLSVFTSPGTLDREFDLDPSAFESVLEVVRRAVPSVVIDLPHVWSAWSRSVLLDADEIVIVAGPDLASLRNAKNLVERIKVARPNDNPPRLVLNMVGMPKRPEIPPKDFADAIGLEPSAVINFEPNLFGTASNNGQMLPEVDKNAAAVKAVEDLAALITGRSAPAEKKGSFLDRLMGKKSA